MFTKTLIAAFFLATCSYGADENCLSEYYASCGMGDTCCGQMDCWNGGDPYHCQISCWSDRQCQTEAIKEQYGDLICVQTDIAGFCR